MTAVLLRKYQRYVAGIGMIINRSCREAIVTESSTTPCTEVVGVYGVVYLVGRGVQSHQSQENLSINSLKLKQAVL